MFSLFADATDPGVSSQNASHAMEPSRLANITLPRKFFLVLKMCHDCDDAAAMHHGACSSVSVGWTCCRPVAFIIIFFFLKNETTKLPNFLSF